MLRRLITFLVGVYSGICVCQNYELPRMNNPKELVEKVKEYVNQKTK